MSETEDRLVRLETLSAEHERVINDLSDMVAGQWQAIDKLEKTCDHLRSIVQNLQDRLDETEEEPPPPHY